jgi:hypothetical protein
LQLAELQLAELQHAAPFGLRSQHAP